MGLVCVNCMAEQRALVYTEQGRESSRLSMCRTCREIADMYVGLDGLVVAIDLMMFEVKAYRHFLFNRWDPRAVCICVMLEVFLGLVCFRPQDSLLSWGMHLLSTLPAVCIKLKEERARRRAGKICVEREEKEGNGRGYGIEASEAKGRDGGMKMFVVGEIGRHYRQWANAAVILCFVNLQKILVFVCAEQHVVHQYFQLVNFISLLSLAFSLSAIHSFHFHRLLLFLVVSRTALFFLVRGGFYL
jgi:Arv1-like family